MSALNVVVTADAVLIVTDGAKCRLNGVYAGDANKCLTVPGKSMAMAFRGISGVGAHLARILDRFENYSDAEAGLGRELNKGHLLNFLRGRWSILAPFDMVVAGLDGNGVPAAFLICNHRQQGMQPYEPVTIERGLFMPPIDAINAEIDDLVDENPSQALYEALMFQRTVQIRNQYAIGGRAVSTRIDRAGITQTVLGAWPDRKGEKLDPSLEFREVQRRKIGTNSWGGSILNAGTRI